MFIKKLIVVALGISFSVCGNARGAEAGTKNGNASPIEVVDELMKELKSGDWKRAVELMDMRGMVDEARQQAIKKMERLSEEDREKLKGKAEALSEKDLREAFIGNLKAAFSDGFEYRIIEAKQLSEEKAVVFVELKRDGKMNTDSIPLEKIDGEWKVTFRNLVKYYRPAG